MRERLREEEKERLGRMGSRKSSDVISFQEVWCTSLSDKFRNARRNMDSQEVMMKRRKLMYHSLQQST